MQLSRATRRICTATLTCMLVVPGVVVLGAAPDAQAVTRHTALAQGASYARTHGYTIGIAVLDTKTGAFYGSGRYNKTTFASESLIKVFIAARLLVTHRMHGSTERRAYKMITQSDDAIASAFYGSVGGDSLINWVKAYFHQPDLGTPPHRTGFWGNTHVRAKGLVHLYAKLKANRTVGPWLLNAMHHATTHGSDGTYQFFGIPSATKGAAVKQGWGIDFDYLSADFNTTGFVDNDRYVVAILARGRLVTYGAQIGAMLTQVARRVLPGGVFPDPIPTITALSTSSGAVAGGTAVTVHGTDLTGVRTVYFGTVPARSVTRTSRSRLVAIAPARATGLVDVRVATTHGTTARVAADHYRYVPAPNVATLAPTSGPAAGTTPVTLTGTGFQQVSKVLFGTTAATQVQLSTDQSALRVLAPPHAAGRVAVTVVTRFGTSTGVSYTYVG